MANSICDSSPIAVRYAKQLMTRGKDLPIEEALRIEDDFQTLIMRTMDFEEGLKAFKEKRKPEWQGK
jgi:enoyl-CoA hydratase/carnithine racemase